MKFAVRISLLASILLFANLLRAQLNGVDLSAVEATTPLPPDQIPVAGTFYSAQNPNSPPLPGNFFGWSCWPLGGGNFLMDDLGGSFGGGFSMMSAMDDSVPIPGEGGDEDDDEEFTNNFSFTFPTNGLWLWITNISNGTVYANLNGATDYVYEIFSTTNLAVGPAVTNWNIETEVFPGTDTNVMSFTVPMNGRNPLFLWARDWTGITSNGNLTPDWWFYYWFGIAGLSLSDNTMDSQDNSLYYDYTNGNDPNVIQFNLIVVTNDYYSSSVIPAQLNVVGIPYYITTLVDDTNFDDAVWNTFTSTNITVNLGSTEGWHNVWIGLRGHADDPAIAQWQWRRFKLDFTPPALVITGPTNATVDVPMIQLTGYSLEDLSSISYDMTNSAGLLANQQICISDRYFDDTSWEFTTNSFQGYDVFLTNGVNGGASFFL